MLSKYESLLRSISNSSVLFDVPFHDLSEVSNSTNPILRHDVDFTLVGVKEVAQLDASFGHKSIFLFRPDARSYNLESSHAWDLIQYVASLGHEIGLHIDRRSFMANPDNYEATSDYLKYFESRLQQSVRFMSWHRPLPIDLGGNENFLHLKSLYSNGYWNRELYLSDSSGNWSVDREKRLLDQFLNNGYFQLLIHHEWWLDDDVSKSFARSYSQQIQNDIIELRTQIPFEELKLEECIAIDFLNTQTLHNCQN